MAGGSGRSRRRRPARSDAGEDRGPAGRERGRSRSGNGRAGAPGGPAEQRGGPRGGPTDPGVPTEGYTERGSRPERQPEPDRGTPRASRDEPRDEPERGRGRPRWMLPAALAAVALAAGVGAIALDGEPSAEAVGVDRVVATPVLSARRVPEVLAAPVADRRLADDVQGWLAASPPDTCLVVEADGRPAVEHNPSLPVAGASTQKLITATGLLLAVGPDATFRTDAVAEAAPSDGVVAGDLFVVGGGPADLGTTDWLEMSPGTRPRVVHDVDGLVTALREAGVTRIEGSVVGDGSRYDDEYYQPSLASRFLAQDQAGPVDSLMVNDGFAQFSPARTFDATVPAADPVADAARVITERLEAGGITVVGPPRSGTAPAGATVVASLESPPVSQLVGEMLSTSDNEAAEAMLKEIGVATGGEGTWDAGRAALPSLLADAGAPVEGIEVVDGSGLAIENRLTCGTLVDLLTLDGTGPVVREGLAVAGETGTLRDRWKGTEVAGRLRGKTGTLRNVTALAGEVEPVQGGSVTFAYVANVPDPREITPGDVRLDELASILVAYPRGVDMAALEPQPPA